MQNLNSTENEIKHNAGKTDKWVRKEIKIHWIPKQLKINAIKVRNAITQGMYFIKSNAVLYLTLDKSSII